MVAYRCAVTLMVNVQHAPTTLNGPSGEGPGGGANAQCLGVFDGHHQSHHAYHTPTTLKGPLGRGPGGGANVQERPVHRAWSRVDVPPIHVGVSFEFWPPWGPF